jgi:hypothetical protein
VMGLVDKQSTFAGNVARLILWILDHGYQVTMGEGYDDDGVGHMKGSLHYSRLAIDLNLFKDGKYLSKTEDYKRAGEAWKSLHPDNRWGGDFKSADGNHFSMAHEGRA